MIVQPIRSVFLSVGLSLAIGAVSVFSYSVPSSAGPRQPTLGEFVSSKSGSVGLGWQRSSGISKDAWLTAVGDETVKVGSRGRTFVVEPLLPAHRLAGSPRAAPIHSDIPLTDAFALHSRPGSTKVIYLDFNGQTMTNTAWSYPDPLVVPAYSIDGSASFSSTEKQNIIDAWSAVAEDYSMFDVDVTTEDPGQSAIDRTSYSDDRFGVRALITDENNGIADIACPTGCQGVAYVGTFDYVDPTGDWEWYSPAFAFSRPSFSGKILSDVISHEVGHNLGLSHDGQGNNAYYLGRSGWAPIMGAGYNQPLVQWSIGDYQGATNREDDFAIMRSYGLSLLADDFGNSAGTATTLSLNTSTSGTIHSRSDVDYFRFVPGAASVDIAVTLPSGSPNLDCSITVLNSLNRTVATANPSFLGLGTNSATGLTASITVAVTKGQTYFVKVDGVGVGKASSNGYSDYGSVGEYRLSVSGETQLTLAPGTPTISGTLKVGNPLTVDIGSWESGVETSQQWLRNGSPIASATGTSYVLQRSDGGKRISVAVTASKSGYTTMTATSASTGKVAK